MIVQKKKAGDPTPPKKPSPKNSSPAAPPPPHLHGDETIENKENSVGEVVSHNDIEPVKKGGTLDLESKPGTEERENGRDSMTPEQIKSPSPPPPPTPPADEAPGPPEEVPEEANAEEPQKTVEQEPIVTEEVPDETESKPPTAEDKVEEVVREEEEANSEDEDVGSDEVEPQINVEEEDENQSVSKRRQSTAVVRNPVFARPEDNGDENVELSPTPTPPAAKTPTDPAEEPDHRPEPEDPVPEPPQEPAPEPAPEPAHEAWTGEPAPEPSSEEEPKPDSSLPPSTNSPAGIATPVAASELGDLEPQPIKIASPLPQVEEKPKKAERDAESGGFLKAKARVNRSKAPPQQLNPVNSKYGASQEHLPPVPSKPIKVHPPALPPPSQQRQLIGGGGLPFLNNNRLSDSMDALHNFQNNDRNKTLYLQTIRNAIRRLRFLKSYDSVEGQQSVYMLVFASDRAHANDIAKLLTDEKAADILVKMLRKLTAGSVFMTDVTWSILSGILMIMSDYSHKSEEFCAQLADHGGVLALTQLCQHRTFVSLMPSSKNVTDLVALSLSTLYAISRVPECLHTFDAPKSSRLLQQFSGHSSAVIQGLSRLALANILSVGDPTNILEEADVIRGLTDMLRANLQNGASVDASTTPLPAGANASTDPSTSQILDALTNLLISETNVNVSHQLLLAGIPQLIQHVVTVEPANWMDRQAGLRCAWALLLTTQPPIGRKFQRASESDPQTHNATDDGTTIDPHKAFEWLEPDFLTAVEGLTKSSHVGCRVAAEGAIFVATKLACLPASQLNAMVDDASNAVSMSQNVSQNSQSTGGTNPPHVFVSHTANHQILIGKVTGRLKTHGMQVWQALTVTAPPNTSHFATSSLGGGPKSHVSLPPVTAPARQNAPGSLHGTDSVHEGSVSSIAVPPSSHDDARQLVSGGTDGAGISLSDTLLSAVGGTSQVIVAVCERLKLDPGCRTEIELAAKLGKPITLAKVEFHTTTPPTILTGLPGGSSSAVSGWLARVVGKRDAIDLSGRRYPLEDGLRRLLRHLGVMPAGFGTHGPSLNNHGGGGQQMSRRGGVATKHQRNTFGSSSQALTPLIEDLKNELGEDKSRRLAKMRAELDKKYMEKYGGVPISEDAPRLYKWRLLRRSSNTHPEVKQSRERIYTSNDSKALVPVGKPDDASTSSQSHEKAVVPWKDPNQVTDKRGGAGLRTKAGSTGRPEQPGRNNPTANRLRNSARVQQMSRTDVSTWIVDKCGLETFSEKFERYDGRMLDNLMLLQTQAPEFTAHSLAQKLGGELDNVIVFLSELQKLYET